MIFLDQGNNNGNTKKHDNFQHFKDKFRTLDLEASEYDDNSVRIYLNTLSSFSDSRSGSYALSSLKKMTGTDGFLQQTDAQKKCRNEFFEDCQTQSYIYTVKKKCGCVPWALSSAVPAKVLYTLKFNFHPQDFQICSVRNLSCYTAVPRYFPNCGIPCKGLFADVEFTQDRMLDLETDLGER